MQADTFIKLWSYPRTMLLVTLFSVYLMDGPAQTPEGTYHSAEGFDYYEIVYGSELGNKNLPLLVAFHFSSSSPEELLSYYDSLRNPVRIIIPRGNHPKRNGYSYFPADHYNRDSVSQAQTVRITVDSIAVFLKSISKKYKVKPVVSGISQGGDISLLLAVYYPRLIKASFPLLGFMHKQVYRNLKSPYGKGVSIFMYQGEEDKIVNLDYTKKEVDFLKNIFEITLFTYPGIAHDVSATMEKDYSTIMNKWLR